MASSLSQTPPPTDAAAIRDALSRYEAAVGAGAAPFDDAWRVTKLASDVQARDPPHMTMKELTGLLECKMKRGKRRVWLPSQIKSNGDVSVINTTTSAFAQLPLEPTTEQILSAMKMVSKLNGVGPATASYVLAAYRPLAVPLFSDEGFRWALFQEAPDGNNNGDGKKKKNKGTGWDREITYTWKEFAYYLERMQSLAKDTALSVVELEMAAFVFGKEAAAVAEKAEDVTVKETGGIKRKDAAADDEQTQQRLSKRRRSVTFAVSDVPTAGSDKSTGTNRATRKATARKATAIKSATNKATANKATDKTTKKAAADKTTKKAAADKTTDKTITRNSTKTPKSKPKPKPTKPAKKVKNPPAPSSRVLRSST